MYIQRPTPPNEWLYEDKAENERYFTEIACLPSEAYKFNECTDADKQAWEEAHKPAEPEVQEAEVIDEQ